MTNENGHAKSSIFDHVDTAPPDAILGLNAQFRADPSPNKVNLGVGAYRTATGDPYVLPVVRRVEQRMAADPASNHEYLPQDGLAAFSSLAAQLILGPSLHGSLSSTSRLVSVQALSGTGALRLGLAFVHKFVNSLTQVYIPDPTWTNHFNIVLATGLPKAKMYRYFDPKTGGVDFDGMIQDLSEAPPRSIIILHPCAHNPTGADPTPEQWQQLLDLCTANSLIPFFDSAYQGFASGDLDIDAASVRLFAAAGLDMFVSQSFAKNLGLYGERIGALTFISNGSEHATMPAVKTQLKGLARTMYSSPPLHGARIVTEILSDQGLFAEWRAELKGMAQRIAEMRIALRNKLEEIETPGTWEHITSQIGMFSFTRLTKNQVLHMREHKHIYMTANGRISMAGLTADTIEYVATAMRDAIIACPAH